MLQKKHVADYLNSQIWINNICDVYADAPMENNIPQGNYIYPVTILDSQDTYSDTGLSETRTLDIRINVVVKSEKETWEYAEGIAYNIFDKIDGLILQQWSKVRTLWWYSIG